MRNNKSLTNIIGLFLGTLLLFSGNLKGSLSVSDDFSQFSLGPEWVRIGGNDRWSLEDERLIYRAPTVADSILFNRLIELNEVAAWKLEAGIRFPDQSLWSGVAFNIQATDPHSLHLSGHSCYVFRVNPARNAIQWLKYLGGGSSTPQVLVNTTSTKNIPVEKDLRIVVQAIDNNGTFQFQIWDDSALIYETQRVNGDDPFSGGSVGYFASGSTVNSINSAFFSWMDATGAVKADSNATFQELLEKLQINWSRSLGKIDFFGRYSTETGQWTTLPMLDYNKPELAPVEAAVRAGDYDMALALIGDQIFRTGIDARTFLGDTFRLLDLVETNLTREITDADFFGKRDNRRGGWIIPPMLDYDIEGLAGVEEAAIAGDYVVAAKRLFEYFRQREFHTKPLRSTWHAGLVELWSEGTFTWTTREILIDRGLQVSNIPQEYKINVAIPRSPLAYMLMGRHKNDSLIYVTSGHSRIELYRNGQWESYPAVGDTFIRAGRYGDSNFSQATILEIANSGLRTQRAIDDNTRRAYLGFDLSGVDMEGVERARLRFTAWSQNENDKLIIWRGSPTNVFDAENMTWNNTLLYTISWHNLEGGPHWDDKPGGVQLQTIDPIRRFWHWLDHMTAASVLGQDPQMASATIALIRSFINRYPYTSPPGWRRELNASLQGRISNLCTYLPHLLHTESMTPKDWLEIMKFLWREKEYLKLNPSGLYRTNFDNMGIALVKTMMELDAVFPEILDSPLDFPNAYERTAELMEYLVLPDGAYIEHTMGYPFMVMPMLMDLIRMSDREGIQLPPSFKPKTLQLAQYVANMSFPTGFPPNWGEGAPNNTRTDASVADVADYFEDPMLKWWQGRGNSSFTPEFTSVHYPEARVLMSRSGWEHDSAHLFFAPRAGGAHMHVGQNHISLYAYGSKLLVDTGMTSYSYRHPHFDWQRHQTRSHNTVEVDERGYPRHGNRTHEGRGPPEPESRSELFAAPQVEYMRGSSSGYPNVDHHRSILFLKDPYLYIVTDTMVPKEQKSHVYDQCWHLHPHWMFEEDPSENRVWSIRENTANIHIQLLYPNNGLLHIRRGFNSIIPQGETRYPSFRQETAGVANFVTLLLPVRPNGEMEIQAEALPSPVAGVSIVKLKMEDGREAIYIHQNASVIGESLNSVEIKGMEIKAGFAFIQWDVNGQIDFAVMLDGQSLQTKSGEIVEYVELRQKAL